MRTALALLLGGLLALPPSPARAQEHDQEKHQHGGADKKVPGDPYTLSTDPVTGGPLGPPDRQVILHHEGRELRFANKESAEKFRANPTQYLAAVDEKVVAQQAPFYPLTTCLVSGGALGGMGEPVDFVFRNRLVRFCCMGCKGKLLKDPAKYLRALDRAVIEKQQASYPLKTCAVSGEELGGMGQPLDLVVANRLVRLCCKGCRKGLEKDPAGVLARLQPAAGGSSPGNMRSKHDPDGGER